MLHCISHRKPFKKEIQLALYSYVIWIVSAPFFGHTPETYFVHHMGMHHVENNQEDDASSTMKYKRDSLFDFSEIYFPLFEFWAVVDTFPVFFYTAKEKNSTCGLPYGEIILSTFFVWVCAL